MWNGLRVSIAKIMIAIAPATRREAGQLLNAKVGEARFITVVLSFACPAVVAWLSRCEILDAGGLSSGITPWDEWYHAMALAKLDLGGEATCERRSVQGPGHGGASPEKVGQWRPFHRPKAWRRGECQGRKGFVTVHWAGQGM